MTDDNDELPNEQQEDAEGIPAASAVDPRQFVERRKHQEVQAEQVRLFWSRALRDPIGGLIVWQMLKDLHAFEERFACGPNGFPQPEATWFEAGRQSFGLALYHKLALYDREALLALHDRFDPAFAEPKPAKRSRKRRAGVNG